MKYTKYKDNQIIKTTRAGDKILKLKDEIISIKHNLGAVRAQIQDLSQIKTKPDQETLDLWNAQFSANESELIERENELKTDLIDLNNL
ncbi:MAG: hypothetical protein U9R08_02905 [Nanoarchaeota archaeon]|nr:hypothetical protein [Nanoarchaeota archaeon]